MEKNFYQLSKKAVFERVKASDKGLSFIEAKNRLETYGKNKFKETKSRNIFIRFLFQFKDVLILVLLASIIISVVIAITEKNYLEFIDAGIILFIVLVNAITGIIQESKADKAMQNLKAITKPIAKVLRNGKIVKIKTEDLVVGDIVLLEAGDSVPADLRLIESASLKTEEGTLTGESLPVEKCIKTITENVSIGDRLNMVYMGTTVVYGRGKGVVVNTGMNTEMGKIADMLHSTKQEDTPLTKRMKRISIYITLAVLVVSVFILVYGIIKGDSFSTSLMFALAIAVCAVPEGLPACVTITMALGVKEMSKQRAIIKNLPAVETLGSTQVICSDKTGTLTLNKMVVKELFTFDECAVKICNENVNDSDNFLKAVDENKNLNQLVKCMLLCNDSDLKFDMDVLTSIGDPTEVALSEFGYKKGIIKETVSGKYERVNEIPFDSERKLMTTLNKDGDKFVSYTKGAVDNLLEKCDRILVDGKIEKLSQKIKQQILDKNTELANKALRVLGFAQKNWDKNTKNTIKNAEYDMIFIGLVGMMDPPREEVFDAIKICKNAGIRTIMITGDHRDTAFAIANELGIAKNENEVITGPELEKIDGEQFLLDVNKYSVYARVNPEHKVRIVEALKKQGKIVAMTGDGVNDAPSIKKADIGVGMGISGTDVTKEAADIILTDDNFATIVGAVKEGRRVYDNILKIMQFLLGTSLAELIVLTVIIAFLREPFFTPMLILWFNFVSDTLVALALGTEKAEKNIMNRNPQKVKGSLFKGKAGINLLYASLVVSGLVIGIFFLGKYGLNCSSTEATTMCFITLLFAELLHSYNLKSDTQSLFNKNIFKNKWLNWGFLISLVLSLIIVLIPSAGFRSIFGISGLNWIQWLISIGFAVLIIPFMEIEKAIIRKIYKKKE